jgi:hypothetical protein
MRGDRHLKYRVHGDRPILMMTTIGDKMDKCFRYPFLVGLLAVACGGCGPVANWLLFEDRIITTGSFRGLDIGSPKLVVLSQIKALGAERLEAVPSDDFLITRTNLVDLDRVRRTEGLQIRRPKGFVISVYFKDNKVWRIWRSASAQDIAWFREGEGVDEVLATLRSLVDVHSDLQISPAVYYGGQFIPNNLAEAERQILLGYDAWGFWLHGEAEKPEGAFFEVYFAQGRLIKVHYRRARIRLE